VPASSAKIRVISKPRLIAALMAEIDAASAYVMIAHESGASPRTTRLLCDIRVPFETTRVKLGTEEFAGDRIDCTALFAGQRLHFALDRTNDDGEYLLPSEVKITDMRSAKRKKFGPGVDAAEVSTKHGVVMAMPIDLSLNSLALVVLGPKPALLSGDRVVVRIRGESGAADVFNGAMQVQAFQKVEGQTRLLLEGRPFSADASRQVPRMAGLHGTVELCPLDRSLGGGAVAGLQNISMTGFCATMDSQAQSAWLVPGLQLSIGVGALTATLVWVRESGIGVKVNGMDDPDVLRIWVRYVAQLRADSGVVRSEMDEFAGLLTEAGFLKGSRRRLFGSDVTRFLPPERVTENPMLYFRHTRKDDKGDFSGHVSLARLTDSAWIMQEGVHKGDAGHAFGEMIFELTQRANELRNTTPAAPRYVLWLWDSAVKSTDLLSKSFLQQSENVLFSACHLSIVANAKEFPPEASAQVDPMQAMTARERFRVFQRFDPAVLEVFSGGDGSHSRLNAELAKLGHGHTARTVAVGDNAGIWGLAFRLSSYYALNASGMLNTVFLVVRADTTGKQLLDGLARLTEDRFSFGTDDVAVIIDGELPAGSDLLTSLVKPKPYNFMVVDVLLNRVNVTLDDPAAAEKRHSGKGTRPE
jgi:hypothetical protein